MASAGWGRVSTQSNNPFVRPTETNEDSASVQRDQSSFSSLGHGAWANHAGQDAEYQATTPPPAASTSNKAGKSFFPQFTKTSLPTSHGAWSSSAANSSQFPLSDREAELARKEEELRRRELLLAGVGVKTKNWPFFKPILYHNIQDEVPQWHRGMVRLGYIAWNIQALGFFVNWLAVLIFMFSKSGIHVAAFFVCTIATIIGLPASFFLWYRSLYFAAQTDGGMFSYTKTFVYMIVQLAWTLLVVVSPPAVGYFNAGILKMIDRFQDGGSRGFFFGVLCIINIGLWSTGGLLIWFVMARAVQAMRAGDIPKKLWMERLGMSARV